MLIDSCQFADVCCCLCNLKSLHYWGGNRKFEMKLSLEPCFHGWAEVRRFMICLIYECVQLGLCLWIHAYIHIFSILIFIFVMRSILVNFIFLFAVVLDCFVHLAIPTFYCLFLVFSSLVSFALTCVFSFFILLRHMFNGWL